MIPDTASPDTAAPDTPSSAAAAQCEYVRCTYCTHAFCTEDMLTSHLVTRHRYEPAQSDPSLKSDLQAQPPENNNNMEVGEVADKPDRHGYYSCTQCKYQTQHAGRFAQHKNAHHCESLGLHIFRCQEEECFFLSERRIGLTIHRRLAEHSVSKQECPFCSYKSFYTSHVTFHIETAHSKVTNRTYKCPYCSHSFVKGYDLKEHITEDHVDESLYKEYTCNQCQFVAHTNTDICAHINAHNATDTSVKVYRCLRCCFISTRFDRFASHLMEKEHGKQSRQKDVADRAKEDVRITIVNNCTSSKPVKSVRRPRTSTRKSDCSTAVIPEVDCKTAVIPAVDCKTAVFPAVDSTPVPPATVPPPTVSLSQLPTVSPLEVENPGTVTVLSAAEEDMLVDVEQAVPVIRVLQKREFAQYSKPTTLVDLDNDILDTPPLSPQNATRISPGNIFDKMILKSELRETKPRIIDAIGLVRNPTHLRTESTKTSPSAELISKCKFELSALLMESPENDSKKFDIFTESKYTSEFEVMDDESEEPAYRIAGNPGGMRCCRYCSTKTVFKTVKLLHEHHAKAHGIRDLNVQFSFGPRIYRCKYCASKPKFENLRSLKDHYAKFHPNRKNIKKPSRPRGRPRKYPLSDTATVDKTPLSDTATVEQTPLSDTATGEKPVVQLKRSTSDETETAPPMPPPSVRHRTCSQPNTVRATTIPVTRPNTQGYEQGSKPLQQLQLVSTSTVGFDTFRKDGFCLAPTSTAQPALSENNSYSRLACTSSWNAATTSYGTGGGNVAVPIQSHAAASNSAVSTAPTQSRSPIATPHSRSPIATPQPGYQSVPSLPNLSLAELQYIHQYYMHQSFMANLYQTNPARYYQIQSYYETQLARQRELALQASRQRLASVNSHYFQTMSQISPASYRLKLTQPAPTVPDKFSHMTTKYGHVADKVEYSCFVSGCCFKTTFLSGLKTHISVKHKVKVTDTMAKEWEQQIRVLEGSRNGKPSRRAANQQRQIDSLQARNMPHQCSHCTLMCNSLDTLVVHMKSKHAVDIGCIPHPAVNLVQASTSQPAVPLSQPTVPLYHPTVPLSQPTVPLSQPTVPLSQPTVTLSRQDLSAAQPDFSSTTIQCEAITVDKVAVTSRPYDPTVVIGNRSHCTGESKPTVDESIIIHPIIDLINNCGSVSCDTSRVSCDTSPIVAPPPPTIITSPISDCEEIPRVSITKNEPGVTLTPCHYEEISDSDVKSPCEIDIVNAQISVKRDEMIIFECSSCLFVASSARALKQHEQIHSGIIYQCRHCDFEASTQSTLKIHSKSHVHETNS